jgi:two-component system OmpR family sensor kinase
LTRLTSMTRRLILTVLFLELLSAVALVLAITIHERHTQLAAFDAQLQGTAQSLMGAVQDAEDESDSVILEPRGLNLDKHAVFQVDEAGRVLGAAGVLPAEIKPVQEPTIRQARVGKKLYRFYSFQGLRIIDPGKPDGGVRHTVSIAYGLPVEHIWHEIAEATRFFVIATIALLGMTAVIMTWRIRKGLQPIRELAQEAEQISATNWNFNAPISATNTQELQPLAAALESAMNRLQRSFEQQRRFTSDAAHELKTDVAIIKSSLQLLSMKKRTVEEYSQGLGASFEDLARLETTVQKMLTLARLEQPTEASSGSCLLRNVVEDALYQSKAFAEIKDIAVTTQLATNSFVPIDSRDALLLCSNLIVNAIQHSDEHSIVIITLKAQEDNVHFIVEDEGEGIAEEDLAHIFHPFYRGDPSRSRKKGGTGLGLSICKAICDRANGSIAISNRPSGGARVLVVLPLFYSSPLPVSASIKH